TRTPLPLGSSSPHRPARTAVALCLDLPNPWLGTRMRTQNNHFHPPARCLAVGSRDGRYETNQASELPDYRADCNAGTIVSERILIAPVYFFTIYLLLMIKTQGWYT
ncbi:hypothetical protein ACJX0J_017472, partial [Zea mays]